MNQDEYFSVHAGLTINVEPLEPQAIVPSNEAFLQEIPPLFRIASECSAIDDNMERSLTQLNKKEFQSLSDYLVAQNNKINLMLGFIMAQQDHAEHRFVTTTFGASKLTYLSDTPLAVGQAVRLKIFLDKPTAAIYAYAEVSECQQEAEHKQAEITLSYTHLLEADRDIIIRAALHFQQKFLRQRAQQRTEN
ncbi:hypothetical protein ABT56_13725 [Photobacterium aquae]|uniref:PilZ domain-containing protein n=1 Tax=Photobacterium aquae TaxID=1195763 RepID=A0A0J1GYT5_9GAMM|nr:PilZ domain-containing protein [Photobacterium aquae]KLV04775.1 hypothetical protein ABT56_13725 [Photobacterium aquae]